MDEVLAGRVLREWGGLLQKTCHDTTIVQELLAQITWYPVGTVK